MELNQEILRRLHAKQEPHHRSEIPSLLRLIADCDEEQGVYALGPLFKKLRAFVSVVDFQHPDLGSVFDGSLISDNKFTKECKELLQLAEFSQQNGLQVGSLIWCIMSQELPKETMRKLDSPFVNRLHVRFLKSVEDREKVRHTRRMQRINLSCLCKKGEEIWDAQPSNFSRFIRFDMAYQEELLKVEKKAKRYADLGCTDLCNEVIKTVETFKQQLDDSYYGFNRITMTNAAVILAKSLDYSLHRPFMLTEFSNNREYRIVVEPTRHFNGYNFLTEVEMVPYFMSTGSPILHRRSDSGPVAYEPRAYPLHELWSYISASAKEIIGLVDNFPEADGKSIFDHYIVIVPGVDYPKEKDKRFVDECGVVREFNTLEDAKKVLDITLISMKCICPIILGERDSKCYFLCNF